MKRQILLVGVALTAVLAVGNIRVLSKDAKKPAKPIKPEDAFAAMMKAGSPGPQHKVLDVLAGSWKTKVKFWLDPRQEPQESAGTMKRVWVLGGRFLKEDFQGKAADQVFSGLGLVGYDNLKKQYTAAWADSMSTAITTMHGTYDSAKKTFTFTSEGLDPYTGVKMKNRDVLHILSPDHHLQEMYKSAPKGKEYKVLEIDYTRKK